MKSNQIHGVGTALITPFCEDGTIDYDALACLIDKQIDGGVDFIVALGTTGETPTLSISERDEVIRFIVHKVDGRVPIVRGISDNNTAALVETVKSCELHGVSAILSATPYYNKPTQEGLYRHFAALSKASPLPVILYNVPGRTGVNLEPKTVIRLATEFANIIAVKEASGNMSQIEKIIRDAPAGFHVFSGNDGDTVNIISMGGVGVISVASNVFPVEIKQLVNLSLSGKIVEARKMQEERLADIFFLLFKEGNPSGVKCFLTQQRVIKNVLRLPLVPVSSECSKQIANCLVGHC